MRNAVVWSCMSILMTVMIIGSCTNSYGEFDLSESPIGFLKGLNQVTVSFPTDNPEVDVKLKFKKKTGAIKPNLKQAIQFISKNEGYKKNYIRDIYDCKQFAYNLFLDAQKQNYETRFVIIDLKDKPEGHALTAIETVDAGTLFIDFTPLLTADGSQKAAQTFVYVKEGEPYIRIPIAAIEPSFNNSDMDYIVFHKKLIRGEKEVNNFNSQALYLEQKKKETLAKIDSFKSKLSRRQIARSELEQLQDEQDELQREIKDIESRYTHLDYEEYRIKTLYLFTDWIGKDWVVDKIRFVP